MTLILPFHFLIILDFLGHIVSLSEPRINDTTKDQLKGALKRFIKLKKGELNWTAFFLISFC